MATNGDGDEIEDIFDDPETPDCWEIGADKSFGPYDDVTRPLTSAADVDIDDMPVVRIGAVRRGYVQELAALRSNSYAGIDGGFIPVSEWGNETPHEVGVLGEMAVADYFDADIDDLEEIYRRGDDGYDVIIDGYKVDVKTTVTTSTNRPRLLVKNSSVSDVPDVYLLVHIIDIDDVGGVDVRLIGFVDADEIRENTPATFERNIRNKVRALKQYYLKPVNGGSINVN